MTQILQHGEMKKFCCDKKNSQKKNGKKTFP